MQSPDEREMSLIGHLDELRTRLIISILALFACVFLAFFVSHPVLEFLTRPIRRLERDPGQDQELFLRAEADGTLRMTGLRGSDGALIQGPIDPRRLSTHRFWIEFDQDAGTTVTTHAQPIGPPPRHGVYYRKPFDAFMVPLKVSLMLGFLLALPIVLHQVWLFIKPGLRATERKVVRSLLTGAIFLFPLGAMFAFFMVAMVMQMLQRYAPPAIEPLFGIHEYLSVMIMMMVVFGILFELPLVAALASRVGLVTPAMLIHYRRHAYVVLALMAMVLTPADPFSMIMALIPLMLLYEVSILVARPMAYRHQRDLDNIQI